MQGPALRSAWAAAALGFIPRRTTADFSLPVLSRGPWEGLAEGLTQIDPLCLMALHTIYVKASKLPFPAPSSPPAFSSASAAAHSASVPVSGRPLRLSTCVSCGPGATKLSKDTVHFLGFESHLGLPLHILLCFSLFVFTNLETCQSHS